MAVKRLARAVQDDDSDEKSYRELYPHLEPGVLLGDDIPEPWRTFVDKTDTDRFARFAVDACSI